MGIGYPAQPTKASAFAYDGLGRRTTISSTPAGGGTTTTTYLWCGRWPCQARNASNAVIRAYYSEGEYAAGAPTPSAYYARDRAGSVRRVFTSTNAPAYDYDAYGNPLQGTAPATDYVYGGMFYNADSGLYLTPHRAYDPVSGRWLSRDLLGEPTDLEGNLYVYVGGDPLNKTDREGLQIEAPDEEPNKSYQNMPDDICEIWLPHCIERMKYCALAYCRHCDSRGREYYTWVRSWMPIPGPYPEKFKKEFPDCKCFDWEFRRDE